VSHQAYVDGDVAMSISKKKNRSLVNSPEFNEILDVLQVQAKKIVELIQQACVPDSKAKLAVDALVVDIITCEKRIDRLKEAFIEKLYLQKTFLPNMQKNDYLYVVENIDEIADEMEIVGRQFQIFDFSFPDELQNDYIGLAEAIANVVASLVDHVVFLFKDFKMSHPAWIHVQDERRNAREMHWTLQSKLLSLDLDFKHLLMLRALVKILINVVDKAEDFSDNLNALAIKYLRIE